MFELRKVTFDIVSDGREDIKQGFYWLPDNGNVLLGEPPLRTARIPYWFEEAETTA